VALNDEPALVSLAEHREQEIDRVPANLDLPRQPGAPLRLIEGVWRGHVANRVIAIDRKQREGEENLLYLAVEILRPPAINRILDVVKQGLVALSIFADTAMDIAPHGPMQPAVTISVPFQL